MIVKSDANLFPQFPTSIQSYDVTFERKPSVCGVDGYRQKFNQSFHEKKLHSLSSEMKKLFH